MNLEKLKILVNQGYILHGSRKKFDVARPYKNERIPKGAGNKKAVYATDRPLVAYFKAIINEKLTPAKAGLISWRFLKNGDPQFRLTPNFLKNFSFDDGFVYVFKKSEFSKDEKLPHEFYSMKPQRPDFIVGVRPDEFLKIADITVWEKHEVERAGFHTQEQIEKMYT